MQVDQTPERCILNDDAEKVMAAYFDRISHPALTDISIDFGGLQVSEVYRVVEEISGVENSDCEISLLAAAGMATRPRRVVTQLVHGREVARTILAHERQVIYLDPERSTVKVVAEEFEL